ncbi:MAG: sugar phosphate isomerase/epimerase family protein [Verrucomicrobiota bacterium]
MNPTDSFSRRRFLAGSTALATMPALATTATAQSDATTAPGLVTPPETGKKILLSCKLGMITKKDGDRELTVTERLKLAGEAGFDGVDFDEAGKFTLEEARQAVAESKVFVHNAINHDHWKVCLTNADENIRAKGIANLEHCIRLSHAAGGNGVLLVIGKGGDGSKAEVADRSRKAIQALIPLAASLGQPILFENVWNRMFYDHDGAPEQSPQEFIDYVDSFNSPWVGMYYDIGNHWKYGQCGEWIRAFGHRCVKLDVKGFSRQYNKFTDIGEGDLPWDQVRKALDDIGFTGWATAEVGGGGVERLTKVRKQMEQAFGLV